MAIRFEGYFRLSESNRELVDYVLEALDDSRSSVDDDALVGIRTVQINEFIELCQDFAETLPDVSNPIGRPGLPGTPEQFTVADIIMAVKYIFGVQYRVSVSGAELVIARLVEDFNGDNSLVPDWSRVEVVMYELIDSEIIEIEMEV